MPCLKYARFFFQLLHFSFILIEGHFEGAYEFYRVWFQCPYHIYSYFGSLIMSLTVLLIDLSCMHVDRTDFTVDS